MARIDSAINIDDLRRMAKRRLPKIMFDFIEGGVEDEIGLRTNANAFRDMRLVPRYYVDTSKRTQKAALFGRDYASPFGIAPTGMAGAFRRDAELYLAQAAAEADVPYLMSGAANASMEQGAKLAPRNLWYQIYGARNRDVAADLVKRAIDCGVTALAVTCDVPVASNRERNRRNGFVRPLRMTLPTILEAMLHPAWVLNYYRSGGLPMLENWQPYAPSGASAEDVYKFTSSVRPFNAQTWRDLEAYRKLFPRGLVVKGVMDPRDALRAIDVGCDGILVSNHGGRQLDQAPGSLDVLPAIKAAVGDKATILLDSGARRGADILIALCLGADFVFFGRPTLYGAAAGGLPGVMKAVDIFRTEIDHVMGQIGCPSLDQLGPDFLWHDDWQRNA